MPSKTINEPEPCDEPASSGRRFIDDANFFRNFNYALMGASCSFTTQSRFNEKCFAPIFLTPPPLTSTFARGVDREHLEAHYIVAKKIGRAGGVGGENAISSGAFDL